MIAIVLGLLAAGLGLAVGAPWWILAAAAPYLVPGRLGPAIGALAIVALLPWQGGPPWQHMVLFSCGVLAGWGVLYRMGHAVPWVAVPWWIGGLLLLEAVWSMAGPRSYWTDSDVAVRLRILVLMAMACLGLAVHYFPRYRNDAPAAPEVPGPLEGLGGGGTSGGLDETR